MICAESLHLLYAFFVRVLAKWCKLCSEKFHWLAMDCTEEEDTPRLSPMPRDILALPAREVLSYTKIRDPLSLQLNMVGALKNWKDVADLLGYSAERILGYFAHNSRPGLLLLEDWIYKKNGILETLVNILSELEFYSCLEVIRECVEGTEILLCFLCFLRTSFHLFASSNVILSFCCWEMSEKFNLKRLVWSDVNLYLSLRIYVNHDFQD